MLKTTIGFIFYPNDLYNSQHTFVGLVEKVSLSLKQLVYCVFYFVLKVVILIIKTNVTVQFI